MGTVRRIKSRAQGCGPLIPSISEAARPLRQQIFERVRAAGYMPRVQVARELGVSPASVTTLTSELIDMGLLEEVSAQRDQGDGGRGRPAVALGVRADARLVAGIKLSDREHTAVIVDFAGNLIADEAIPRQPGAMELADLVDVSATLVAGLCSKAQIDVSQLSAIGLGVPGFVDSATGVVHWSPVLAGRHVPLARAAGERLGRPVHIDNDANLVTLAEPLVRRRPWPVGFCRRDHRARAWHGLRHEPPHLSRRAGARHGAWPHQGSA